MIEIICNLHIHSIYSDGTGDYTHIANEAIRAGVDVVIITDHNVWVKNMERYVDQDEKRVLLLTGEEVHDQDRIRRRTTCWSLGAIEKWLNMLMTRRN